MKELDIILIIDGFSDKKYVSALDNALETTLKALKECFDNNGESLIYTSVFVSGKDVPVLQRIPLSELPSSITNLNPSLENDDRKKTVVDAFNFGINNFYRLDAAGKEVNVPCYIIFTSDISPIDEIDDQTRLFFTDLEKKNYRTQKLFKVIFTNNKNLEAPIPNVFFHKFSGKRSLLNKSGNLNDDKLADFIKQVFSKSSLVFMGITSGELNIYADESSSENENTLEEVATNTSKNIKGVLKFLAQGYDHSLHGKDCQDYAEYFFAENGNVILALSDGCSSSLYAKEAAKANVDAIIDLFANNTLESLVSSKQESNLSQTIIGACRDKISEISGALKSDNKSDFCATLIFAVSDGNQVLFGHLGDGLLCAVDDDGLFTYLSDPENGESTSHTVFTVSPNAFTGLRLRVINANKINQLFLCSDGPYAMLKEANPAEPTIIAKSILSSVNEGAYNSNDDFCRNIIQLPISTRSKMDDWSILIGDTRREYKTSDLNIPLVLNDNPNK